MIFTHAYHLTIRNLIVYDQIFEDSNGRDFLVRVNLAFFNRLRCDNNLETK